MIRAEANTTIVTINDWRHRPTEEVNALWEEARIEPLYVLGSVLHQVMDSSLIAAPTPS